MRNTKPSQTTSGCRAPSVVALCLAAWLMMPGFSRADDGPGEFAVFELRHTRAAELAPLVEQALRLRAEQAEIVVDAARNRLLVRGEAPAKSRVRELIATLDHRAVAAGQPAGPAPRAARSDAPARPTLPARQPNGAGAFHGENVLAGYSEPVEAAPAESIEAAPAEATLRRPRPMPTAPPAAAQRPAPRQPAARPPMRQPAGPAMRKSPAKRQPTPAQPPLPYDEIQKLVGRPSGNGEPTMTEIVEIPLTNVPADALAGRLKQLVGKRLAPLVSTSEGVASYVIQLPGHTPLEIHIEGAAEKVVLRGPAAACRHCARLIEALDAEPVATDQRTRVVSLAGRGGPFVRQALTAIETSELAERPVRGGPRAMKLVANLFQRRGGNQPTDDEAADEPMERDAASADEQAANERPATEADDDEHGALSEDIEIERVEDLGAIIIRGSQRDVERVMKMIEDIEKLSAETEPVIEVRTLRHIASEAMAGVIEPLYNDELGPRQGRVSITPLVHPNALLLIGQADSVKSVVDLISRLDLPSGAATQFEVFHLRHATAANAAATLMQSFGAATAGLAARLRVTPDARTNALIVQAGPRDLLEIKKLLKQLDSPGSAAISELRLFRLRYASAAEVALLLSNAVQPRAGGPAAAGGQAPAGFAQQQQGFQGGQQQGGGPGAAQAAAQQGPQAAQEAKSITMRLLTVDAEGRRQLSIGHLADIRISADVKTNTVVVSAPAESLDLIAALISQLDQPHAVPAQIKVFTLDNGDATNMVTMLEDLFQVSASPQALGGQQQFAPTPQVTSSDEGGAVPLRFSVDARTNSIIASGSASDLIVVEAILLRLDGSDVRDRRSVVYKLKNAPAVDVALSINEYLQKERQTQQTAPGLLSPFEKIEREVVVVPEVVTNSLIVSATPRFFDEIARIVEQLDARSPMVMIQVMIAEVTLNNTDEFGIELGLQNSVMFDRSLLSGFQLINTVSNQANPGGGVITVQNQSIVGANNTPGYDFNNPTLQGALPPPGGTSTAQSPFSIGLPNSGATTSLNTSSQLGSQGLSNFGMGRVNSDLGFGGLVLSLSSDTVNFLLRALRERRRLDVLSRPQVMTLDNQPAYIVVGQKVPLLSGSGIGITGAVTNVQYTNVGLIVAVTPRVAPDGLVVMEIDAEKSLLGPLNEGIPVGFGALGQVLRQPRIDITQAQTTISAMDGQTIVFGGLITQSSQVIQRRVPGISEIPIIGRLFRYDYQNGKKSELLIIMTPHVVRNEFDAEKLKRTEAGRISWCLADVRKIHGEAGLRNRGDEWLDHEIPTIYPDMDPTGGLAPNGEAIPSPPGMPAGPRTFSPSGQPMPNGQTPPGMQPPPGQATQTSARSYGARTASRPDTSRRTGPGNEVRIRSTGPAAPPPPRTEGVERASYQSSR